MRTIIAQCTRALARWGGDEGATALEYGIIVALVVLAVVLAITAFGGAVNDLFVRITARLPF